MTTIRTLAAAGLCLACAISPVVAAPFAYVANFNGNSVSVIDIATNTVVATVPVGCNAMSTKVDDTGSEAFVACGNTNDIVRINAATNTVSATIFACNSSAPRSVAATAGRIYVSCGGLGINNLVVLDRATTAILATIPVGSNPGGIAKNPSGSRIYVSNVSGASVSVVDTATDAVIATVPVGTTPRSVTVDPSGSRAYVPNAVSATVSVIDTATNTVVATIPVGTQAHAAAVSPDGSRVVVTNRTANSVSVIDAASNTVLNTYGLGAGTSPTGVAIPPEGTRAYIANQTANNVSIMDIATGTLSTPVAVGNTPNDVSIIAASPPSVTIDQAAAQVDPTNASTINFTAVFSEAVTGFTGTDVSFTGSTVAGTLVANVTGGPTTYNVAVSGMTGPGNVVVGIPAGRAADLVGSPSLASTSTDNTVAYVDPPPTVAINQAIAQVDPATGPPITFTVVFSEPVTGFTGSDVSFAGSTAGGTLVAAVSGSGTTYTVSVTGMTTSGNVVASVPAGGAQDSVGNANLASTSTDNTVAYVDAPPTVTVNQAAGQVDPAGGSSPIVFTVVFSEAVTGFTGSDVSFAGSTVGGTLVANVTGSGASYTVAASGMTGNGTLVASIPAAAAQDSVGNPSVASTSTDNTVTFDGTAPTVTINQAGGQADPASASPLTFAVVFSETVTGFTGADVSFAGSTATGTLVASVTGSGATYTVSVSGMTGNGTVVASIPAAAASDLAGNASAASTSTDNSVIYTGAGAIVTSFTAPSATGTGSITASFTGGGATCSFSGPQFIGMPPGSAPIPPTAPAGGVGFPHGLFAFTTINCTPGSTLAFTITYPNPLPPGTQYWKYGPEPGNATPHWYVLPATITGNVATFSITDGAQGDDDLAANGTIVDQGGPGFPVGPGAQQTPTMSQWAMVLMALLMAIGAVGGLRRRG